MGWGLRHGSISVPDPDQTQADKYPVVRSDYDALAGVQIIPDNLPSGENTHHTKYIRWGVWGWPTFDNDAISAGKLLRYREGSFRDVTDVHRHACGQWLRASQSIPLNIAEGNGKRSPKDRVRYIEIASEV